MDLIDEKVLKIIKDTPGLNYEAIYRLADISCGDCIASLVSLKSKGLIKSESYFCSITGDYWYKYYAV